MGTRRGAAITAAILLLAACQPSGNVASPGATSSPATSSAPAQSSPSPSAAFRVVTIGDSIPFGQGDCGGCADFTTLVAQALQQQTGETVAAVNLSSHDNLTGARLLDRIRTNAAMRAAVAQGDMVIVTIGHNDTPWNSTDDPCDGNNPDGVFNWSKYVGDCVTQQAARHGQELDAILAEIQALRKDAPTAIRVTTDYNDIIGDPTVGTGGDAPSKAVIDAFAQQTCDVAQSRGAICVDVYHAFNGPDGTDDAGALLAGDHTHPNADGQRRIADVIVSAGFAPLVASTADVAVSAGGAIGPLPAGSWSYLLVTIATGSWPSAAFAWSLGP
jgi:lysophospholipase L1-like esterase